MVAKVPICAQVCSTRAFKRVPASSNPSALTTPSATMSRAFSIEHRRSSAATASPTPAPMTSLPPNTISAATTLVTTKSFKRGFAAF